MQMTIRTCATCAAFDAGRDPTCINLVAFATNAKTYRAPRSTDGCPGHLTHAEDASETRFVEAIRAEGGQAAVMRQSNSIFSATHAIRRAKSGAQL